MSEISGGEHQLHQPAHSPSAPASVVSGTPDAAVAGGTTAAQTSANDVQSFKQALLTSRPNEFLNNYIFDRVPAVFAGDRVLYISWKHRLSKLLEVDANELVIVGSAALGFSLNPAHPFTSFDDESDVDVAVISSYHFAQSWRFLRASGSLRARLSPRELTAFDDHRTRLIYWGTIATDRILQHLPFGPAWMDAIDEMQKHAPTVNRDITFRVYNDFDALRSYQRQSIVNAREYLLTA